MNILYTITSYLPSIGGAQYYLHEIAKRAAGEHNVSVVSFFNSNRNDWLLGTTLKAQEKESSYIYESVNVRQISFSLAEKIKMFPSVAAYYFNKPNSIKVISKLLENKLIPFTEKIDLIHNVRVGREPLSYASFNIARSLKIPFVFTPLHHPRWGHWFFKEYQYLYRQADCIFALTEHEKMIYESMGISPDKVFVTGTGPVLSDSANPDDFRSKYNVSGQLVLFVGQGYRYKGMAELIGAANILLRDNPNIDFMFIGPHTEYSRKLFQKQQNPRIRHMGKVDLQTKTDALAACDIFCLPSSQESFGAVFLEAWSFSKPVVGVNIPQLRCLVDDGIDGFLVDPTPDNIAAKIQVLLSDSRLRSKLGAAGKKKAQDNFTWDVLYRKTISAYEKTLIDFKG